MHFVQRLNNAFRFIDLNFRMAQKHEAIQKPWMFLSLGGMILTLFWWIPLGVLIVLLGSWPFAWVLIGFIFLLYLLSLHFWGEITALQTAQIFAGLVHEDVAYKAAHPLKGIFQNPWLAVLVYVLSVPGLTLMMGLQEILSDSSPPEPNRFPTAGADGCAHRGARGCRSSRSAPRTGLSGATW